MSENLRRLRKQHNLSQADMAQIAGVSDKAISTWELRKKMPRMASLQRIATHFGLKLSDLIEGDVRTAVPLYIPPENPRFGGKPAPSHALDGQLPSYVAGGSGVRNTKLGAVRVEPQRLAEAFYRATPATQQSVCKLLDLWDDMDALYGRKIEMIVYTDPAAAGLPLYAESDYERMSFDANAVPPGADFGIRISGDSMSPTIYDGQIVWVRKQDELFSGDVGIFMLADSAVCKRLHTQGRTVQLQSDNPKYPPITGADLLDMRVVGKVLT